MIEVAWISGPEKRLYTGGRWRSLLIGWHPEHASLVLHVVDTINSLLAGFAGRKNTCSARAELLKRIQGIANVQMAECAPMRDDFNGVRIMCSIPVSDALFRINMETPVRYME